MAFGQKDGLAVEVAVPTIALLAIPGFGVSHGGSILRPLSETTPHSIRRKSNRGERI